MFIVNEAKIMFDIQTGEDNKNNSAEVLVEL